jgi:hypothetical protein
MSEGEKVMANEPYPAPLRICEEKKLERVFNSKWFSIYRIFEKGHAEYEKGYGDEGHSSNYTYAVRDNVTKKMQEMSGDDLVVFLADKYAKHCDNPDPSCPFIVEHTVGCSVL